MDNINISLSIIIALLIALFLGYVFFWNRKLSKTEEKSIDNNTRQMRLQAYERLTLLVDRIALPNLISRLGSAQISAREMQMILIQNIRQEFDYNITQQIYVSTDVWTAVKNLKDQNMLLVNQIATALPIEANALDLNKAILDFLNGSQNLNDQVNALLSNEAKNLL
jgi:hypothetical protein